MPAQPLTTFHTIYDGDGKRIKKVTANETTVFVYSVGKLVAEYSNDLAPTASTKYVATDTLGSIRAISDQSGNIISRRDFMPFGEEMYAGTPNRDASQKYSTDGDNVRQKFTGYERDKETGLDFAEARYYKSNHGRFTAVDPLLASGKSANPQTFNRYSYVVNSPLAFTDPSGLQAATPKDEPGLIERLASLSGMRIVNRPYERTHIQDAGVVQAENARIERVGQNILNTNTLNPFANDPKLTGLRNSDTIASTLPGVEIGARRFVNSPVTTPFIGPPIPGFQLSLGDLGVPLIVDQKQPENVRQSFAAFTTEVGLGFMAGSAVFEAGESLGSFSSTSKISRTGFNPFEGKSAPEIDQMFKAKGFDLEGGNPIKGYGGYVNPKTGRSYHIDPEEFGNFREPNHVDVNRSKNYKGMKLKKKGMKLKKRKFKYER